MLYKYKKIFLLLFAITTLAIIEFFAPIILKSYIFSISTLIKDIIIFILPIAIFFCILSSILKLGKNALPLMLGLFVCIFISNVFAHSIAFFPAIFATHFTSNIQNIELSEFPHLTSAFLFKIKNPITPIKALTISTVCAIYISIFAKNKITVASEFFHKIGTTLLKKIIAPIAPFFIFGVLVKTFHERFIFKFINSMPIVFFIFTISSCLYALLLYILFARQNFKNNIINMLPAFFVGMASMSSSIAIPTLIKCVNKNLNKETDVTNIVTPYVSNFHSVAGSFLLPIFSFYVYSIFNNGTHISFLEYLPIAISLAAIKFAGVGVPSGGIIVALPTLYSSILSFDNDMSALIITMYFMADFMNTGLNVLGNGASIIGANKIYYKIINIRKRKSKRI